MYAYICTSIYVDIYIYICLSTNFSIYLSQIYLLFSRIIPSPPQSLLPLFSTLLHPRISPSLSLRFPIQGETIPIRDYANIWLNTELQGKEGYLSIFLRKKSTKMIVLNFKLFFMIISKYFFVIPAILNPNPLPSFPKIPPEGFTSIYFSDRKNYKN